MENIFKIEQASDSTNLRHELEFSPTTRAILSTFFLVAWLGTYSFTQIMWQMGPLGVEEDTVVLAFAAPFL